MSFWLPIWSIVKARYSDGVAMLASGLLVLVLSGCATTPQTHSAATAVQPNAYTSLDNDYLISIRLQREIERESGSRNVHLYDHKTSQLPASYDRKSLLSEAWLGVYRGIVDVDGDGLCETYDGNDRTLREERSDELIKRFATTRDAAEFITAQIINESESEKIGNINTCQFRNPGEVVQFLAYFDLAWLVGYSQSRRVSLQTRNLIEWIPAKVLSTYEHQASNGAPMCSMLDRKRYTHMHMLSHYLWRAHVPLRVDYSWSNSVDELVQQLRYDKLDKWSHAVSSEQYTQQQNRVNGDNGLWLSPNEFGATEQKVMLVEPGSAAERAGVRRGDSVIAINGYSTDALNSRALRRSLQEEMASQGEGDYQIIKLGNTSSQNLSVRYPTTQRNTVYKHNVLSWGDDTVGYLNIKEFKGYTRDELDEVFAEFKTRGVNQLVLDLRYNVGGDTFTASYLAALIIGDDATIYSASRLADPAWNMPTQYLETSPNALGLDQVVALTSEMTASASEQLLNSLKAHVDVVTVGNNTYGKPVIMTGYNICDDLLLVSTQMALNANNQPVPFSGIPATCPVQDSMLTAPDDIANPPMRTALNFLRTGQCE